MSETGRPLESLSSERAEDRAAAFAGLSLEVGDDGVATLEFDQPGVSHNRFTPELLERLGELLRQIEHQVAEGSVTGVVLASAKPESFIVGVDVAAIAAVGSAEEGAAAARQGQEIFQKLAALSVPTVAAVNGTCLGGATEMALACTWRLAADSREVEIGLPEVNLGIFPGFGGSQRLPRTISLERALQLILTGKPVDAGKAARIGLVDAVVPAPLLLKEARRWAAGKGTPQRPARRRRAPEDRPPTRRLRRALLEGNPLGRALVFRQAERTVRSRTGGHYPAPPLALKTVRQGLEMTLPDALQLEARRVGELLVSDEARNLVGIFFSRQDARRRAREGESGRGEPREVGKLGVLGAGVMGGGIAQLAAYNLVPVRLKDVDPGALKEGMGVAHRRLEERRRARRLDERGVARRMAMISPTLEYTGFRHADLVIEAVVERLDVKHQVLAEVERVAGPDTVVATNTSSLTLEALAGALTDPGRLVGLHFFNPVHKMPLVEVVRGEASSPEAVDLAAAFAHRLGKVPVVVRDAPGFLVNRVLMPYLNEALLLLEEGADIAAIDGPVKEFGMPMGPLRLLDEIGLDVSAHVSAELGSVFGDRIPASDLSGKMRDAGRLGKKAGRGFYVYGGKGRPQPDPEVSALLPPGRDRRAPAAAEVVDRCMLAMLNEACRTLDEGIVDGAPGADLALVLGTGFAPFRGGLFRWAQSRGLAEVRERMEALAGLHGERFRPHERLSGGGFYPEDWPRS